MNRIERRATGRSGPRPGAAVCAPGQSNNPKRGMLGGGSLFGRRRGNSVNNQVNNKVNNRVQNTNQLSDLRDLKNQDGKLMRLEEKINIIENNAVMNISDLERRLRTQEDKINLMTDSYRQTMASMKKYIKTLQERIIELEVPKVIAVAKKIERSSIEKVEDINKVTLNIKEKEALS
tara:strand:- start:515 stop:1045 length:531 start_codon:yes stop_codon:yes gene_type:complete